LEGTILRCNEGTAKLLGKPLDEIIGATCWELVHGTSEPIAGCPIVRMQRSRRRETLALPVGNRWLNATVDPLLDEESSLIGAVHVIADITERVRAEEKIKEYSENLQRLVEERTAELREMVNLMAGREVRMAELKEVIRQLHTQLEDAGLTPVADDPLAAWMEE
jgi:PAS domain S-box-containing protein